MKILLLISQYTTQQLRFVGYCLLAAAAATLGSSVQGEKGKEMTKLL
jgi:hypothetical protein